MAHARTVLLLMQELPQSPVKPLRALAAAPQHQQFELESAHGPIVADLFVPSPRFGGPQVQEQPAIILAMGIKTSDNDRPILLGFADTLARLGFVVLWPRLATLDQGAALPEEPSTFIAGIQYLAESPHVDRERISVLGFSVGASTALVAASTPTVANIVHSLVFFGGYHDVLAYVLSLATHSLVLNGDVLPWEPQPDAVGHMRLILEAKDAHGVLQAFEAPTRSDAEATLSNAPQHELAELRRYSPAEHLAGLRARVFILHDEGDPFVPFVESINLSRALADDVEQSFLLSQLFAHAQFKPGVSWQMVRDLTRLYAFVHEVMLYFD